MEIGEIIAFKRKQQKMTIDELSSRSGVPKGTLNKIMSGTTRDPQIETVKAIAHALGCTLDELDGAIPPVEDSGERALASRLLEKYERLNDSGKEYLDAQLDFALAQEKFRLPAGSVPFSRAMEPLQEKASIFAQLLQQGKPLCKSK